MRSAPNANPVGGVALRTLGWVTDALRRIPERRKTVFYLSVGERVDFAAVAQPSVIHDEAGSMKAADLIRDDIAAMRNAARDRVQIEQVRSALRQAMLSNVNVYAIDPAGLAGMENHEFLEEWRKPREGVTAAAMPPHVPSALMLAHPRARERIEFLQSLSENTGGRAIVHTNAPERQVADVFRETGSYYLVGYEPDRMPNDGTYRRVDVKVNRRGVDVQPAAAMSPILRRPINPFWTKPRPTRIANARWRLPRRSPVSCPTVTCPWTSTSRRSSYRAARTQPWPSSPACVSRRSRGGSSTASSC